MDSLGYESKNNYERERSNTIKQCPECGSEKIVHDYDVAEIVCVNCGYVVAEKLVDQKPEWRTFDDEQSRKRIRVGSPLTYTIHDKGLSTTINRRDVNPISDTKTVTQRIAAYKLRKWQNRATISNTTQRNLVIALSELSKVASSLHLPKKVVETAAIIYRKAINKGLVKGRSTQKLTAAAIYISCRQCDVPRTLEEVSNAAHLYQMDVARTYTFIMRKLDMFVSPSKSEKYAAKYSNILMLSGKTEAVAIKILKLAKDLKLTSGRSPKGIAAAATYIASVATNEEKTPREIAKVADVTDITVRNRTKELQEKVLIKIEL